MSAPPPATQPVPPPARHLRRLLSDSAIYGLGGIASQALGIILVPLYARQLGVANYGVLAVINTTLSLTSMVATLALPQAFFRSYLNEAQTPEERRSILAGTLGLRLAVSVAFLALYALLALPLTLLIFGTEQRLTLVLLIAPIVFLDSLNLIPLSYLRAERRAGQFAALAFFRAIFGTVLIVVLVVPLGLGVAGVLIGSSISALVSFLVGTWILVRNGVARPRLDRALWRHMLIFSLPLVPAAVAGWSLNVSDRYVIGAFDGFRAVGVYAAGYTIGLVMNALVVQPFGLAWGAAYWEFARMPEGKRLIARAMTLFVVLASLPALALSVFGTDAVRLLLGPDFEAGRFVIPFSAFGYLLYGVYSIAATGLNVSSQTRWLPITVASAAAANVAINLTAIPLFGFMAAAWSTLLSYGLLALLTGIAAQRYYPVPWDYPRLLGTLGLALGLAAAGLLGPDVLAWRLVCFLAFPVALVVSGILARADVVRTVGWVQRLPQRLRGSP
jgi:O-antigen/teichoic acid export membrane protein